MAKSISTQDAPTSSLNTRNNHLLAWVFERVDEQEEEKAAAASARRMSYQQLLRTLGAWLDTNNACNVNLIETSTGFTLRYGLGDETLLLQRYILTHAELEHLEAAMKERRAINPSGRYQDFLRALGYEIDAQGGKYMVLDEVDENLFLSFCQPSEGGGLSWVKRARVMNPDDRAAILRRAYARRKPREIRRRFWQRILRRQRPLVEARQVA
jgi:hypothetical protein